MKKQRYPVSSLVLLAVVSICVFVVILFSIPHLLGYDDAEKSNISDSEPMILREESFDETNREESVEKSIDDSPPLQSDTLVWSIGFLGTMLLTMVLGMMFGFLGSIPIAGPTSAMILKFGIQGKYRAGQAVAVGGATAEAVSQLINYIMLIMRTNMYIRSIDVCWCSFLGIRKLFIPCGFFITFFKVSAVVMYI